MDLKRLFAALLVVNLLAALILPCAGLAAEARGTVTIAVGTASAVPGSQEAATVPVFIEAGAAYEAHSLDIILDFDPAMLMVTGVSNGSLWYELPDDAQMTCDYRSHPGRVFITVLCPTQGFSGSGVLKNIKFVMAEGCAVDQLVTLTVNEFVCFPPDGAPQDIPHAVQNGAVTVAGQSSVLIGDVNLDGDVTFADVSELYSILTGVSTPSDESMLAADVNDDGEVTFADVSVLYDFLIRG